MKITGLALSNFRSLASTILDMPALTFVTGYNGQGKSSIMDAIRMTLWGRCRYTDRAGRGGVELIVGDGADVARVAVTLERDGESLTVHWSMDLRGNTALEVQDADGNPKFHGQQKDLRRRLAEWSGLNWQHAEVAADPALYLEGTELTGLLAELVTGAVDEARLREATGEHADALLRFAHDAGVRLAGPADFAKLGGIAEQELRECNRKVKAVDAELTALATPETPTAADGKTPLTAAHAGKVAEALAEVEAQLEALLQEKGAVASRLSTDELNERKRQCAGLIVDYRKQLKADEARLAAQQKDHDAAEAILPGLLEAEAKAEAAHGKAYVALEGAKAEVARVARMKDACPTCGQPVSKAVRDKLGAKPSQALAEAQEVEKRTKNALDAAKADADKARSALTQAGAELPALRLSVQSATKAIAEHERALQALDEQEDLRDEATVDAAIAAARERIAVGRGKLEALRALEAYERDKARLDRQAAALASQRRFLSWADGMLRKGELARTLMADGLGAFQDACNRHLGAFGYELEVRVEEKAAVVLVGRAGGTKRPYRGLSDGERTVVQLALAAAYGAGGVVLLDNLDGLDAVNKPIMLGQAAAASEAFGSVVLAGAWGAGDPEAALPGLAAYVAPGAVVWVGDGAARAVDAPAEVGA